MSGNDRFRFSLIISALRGERLVVFYLMAISASIAIGIYAFNENVLYPYERKQSKLQEMQKTYELKLEKSVDYAALQSDLDTALGNKDSCVTTLNQNQQTAQWQECVSKKSVTKRLVQFNNNNKSQLQIFESPFAVLSALALATRDLDLENVFYNVSMLKSSEFSDLLIGINIKIKKSKLPEYITSLNKACASCLIKLASLSNTNEDDVVKVDLNITLYLIPINHKQAIKDWQQAISDGKLSGSHLENYREQPATNPQN